MRYRAFLSVLSCGTAQATCPRSWPCLQVLLETSLLPFPLWPLTSSSSIHFAQPGWPLAVLIWTPGVPCFLLVFMLASPSAWIFSDPITYLTILLKCPILSEIFPDHPILNCNPPAMISGKWSGRGKCLFGKSGMTLGGQDHIIGENHLRTTEIVCVWPFLTVSINKANPMFASNIIYLPNHF